MTPVGVSLKALKFLFNNLNSSSFLENPLIKFSPLKFLIPLTIAKIAGGCASRPNWLALTLILSTKSLRPAINPPLGPGINLSVLVIVISAPKSQAFFWLNTTVLSLAPDASSTMTGIFCS